MINNVNRTLEAIAGAERSGKTYQTEKRANHYARHRGPVIVYNAGRDTDFADYSFIEIVDPYDVAEKFYPGASKQDRAARRKILRRPKVTHFRLISGNRSKTLHFKDFNAALHNKGGGFGKVKLYRITEPKLEELFFEAILFYLSGCLLIVDDARPITKHGVKPKLAELLLKKNHAGRKAGWKRSEVYLRGVDILMIYHNLAKISGEIYDYVTAITMFISNQKPGKNVDNDDLAELITKGWAYLQKAPKYTSLRVHVKGPKAMTAEVVPSSIIKHLDK